MEAERSRKYVKLSDLLVTLEFAPTKTFAEKLIAERRVKVCGMVATSGNMTVASDESDIFLGPKQVDPPPAETELLVKPPIVALASPGHVAGAATTKSATTRVKTTKTTLTKQLSSADTPKLAKLTSSHKQEANLSGENTQPGQVATALEPECVETMMLKQFAFLHLSTAQAKTLVEVGTVTLNGVVITNPKDPVVGSDLVAFVPDIPLWRWVVSLEAWNSIDALERIREGRVLVRGKPVTDPNQIVSPREARLIHVVAPSLALLFEESLCAKKFDERLDMAAILGNRAPVTVAELLVQRGLAQSIVYATYLCSQGRVRSEGDLLMRDPLEHVDDVNLPLTVTKPERRLEAYHQFLQNLSLREHIPPYKLSVESPLETIDDAVVAICEYGSEYGLAWDDRFGGVVLTSLFLSASNATLEDHHQTSEARPNESTSTNAAEAPSESNQPPDKQSSLGKFQDASLIKDTDERQEPPSRSLAGDAIPTAPKLQQEVTRLGDALVSLKIALDEADALALCKSLAIMVNGEVTVNPQTAIGSDQAVTIDTDVETMRRVIPRCTTKSQDALSWPDPAQRELLWAFAGISCLVCNTALEAYACGRAKSPEEAHLLFVDGGAVFVSSKAASGILKGASRVLLQRACQEAWNRWNDVSLLMPYKRQARRAGEFMVGPSSEYFWPLLGIFRNESAIVEFLDIFFLGERDINRRKKSLSLILDFVLYVSDDSLLILKQNRQLSTDAHRRRLESLSQSPGLAEGVWGSAFRAVLTSE